MFPSRFRDVCSDLIQVQFMIILGKRSNLVCRSNTIVILIIPNAYNAPSSTYRLRGGRRELNPRMMVPQTITLTTWPRPPFKLIIYI